MTKYDLIYVFSYILFLTGAAMNFRRMPFAFRVMSAAVLIDFFAVTIPLPGFKSLAITVDTNPLIIAGTIAGVLAWLLFVLAMFSRAMERKMLLTFDGMIAAVQVIWLINLVTIFYGVYVI